MTTQTPARPQVRELATGLLRTRITPLGDDRWEWVREPGPDAPSGFVAPAAHVDAHVRPILAGPTSGASGPVLRPALGTTTGAGRRYVTGSADSVASVLLSRDRPADPTRAPGSVHGAGARDGAGAVDLVAHLRGLGRLLRELHDCPADATAGLRPPRAVERLTAWLAGRPVVGDAAAARDRVRAGLGEPGWRLLTAGAQDLRTAAPVLSHGAPGLGSLVLGGGGLGPVLLTGEDLAAAPPAFDLAWVVGELVELAWQLGWAGQVWQPLLTALFDGYGDDLGPDWHRWAALRVALHVHDFSAYAGAAKAVPAYTSFLRFLLEAGRP